MTKYEYRVVPAPTRGEKHRKARSTAERFAVALSNVMNAMGQEGWDYLRADTLPCEERVGLTGTATHFQHMLVFRRALPETREAEPARPVLRAEPLPPVASLLPDDAEESEATVISRPMIAEPPTGAVKSPFLVPGPRPNGRG